jgi:hypothetical protein
MFIVGGQQNLWQATLGARALVFTTHPGPLKPSDGFGLNEWLGGTFMPRVGQHENVAIVVYRYDGIALPLTLKLLSSLNILDYSIPKYTHAYFPQSDFDEVVSVGHWTVGRKADGYVALYSAKPIVWVTEGDYANKEIIADGTKNVWICELGRQIDYGTFADFIERVTTSTVDVDGTEVAFESPSQGKMKFGWRSPLMVEGKKQDIGQYKRYDNPFSNVEWQAKSAEIEYQGHRLFLDFQSASRAGT